MTDLSGDPFLKKREISEQINPMTKRDTDGFDRISFINDAIMFRPPFPCWRQAGCTRPNKFIGNLIAGL
jgi:hypothetical protein